MTTRQAIARCRPSWAAAAATSRTRAARRPMLLHDFFGLAPRRSRRRTALPTRSRRKYSLARRTMPDRLTSILAMRGECSGNFRSTPSPCTIRRTTNISRVPEPLRAITTPLKIWMRSFSPSRIRVCTSTVSPIWNSGTSVTQARLFDQGQDLLTHRQVSFLFRSA